MRQQWAIFAFVLLTLVAAGTPGYASKPAIPPTVEQMSGAWVGWMDDSQPSCAVSSVWTEQVLAQNRG